MIAKEEKPIVYRIHNETLNTKEILMREVLREKGRDHLSVISSFSHKAQLSG